MDYSALSRIVCQALRHEPEFYHLILDDQGWTDCNLLVEALQKKSRLSVCTVEDLKKMIEKDVEKRFQLKEGKIRVLKASSEESEERSSKRPPNILYYGTGKKYIERIMTSGLISEAQPYVHLSESIDEALKVGKRYDEKPILLMIQAQKAYFDGIMFYKSHDGIWLSENILPEYILRI